MMYECDDCSASVKEIDRLRAALADSYRLIRGTYNNICDADFDEVAKVREFMESDPVLKLAQAEKGEKG